MDLYVARRTTDQSISGTVSTAPAYAGQIFRHDPSDVTALQACTGKGGFVLERGVLDEVPLANKVFLKEFNRPEPTGSTLGARRILEAEYEFSTVNGSNLVVTSGGTAVTSSTAAETELSTAAGKLCLAASGDEVCAILRNQLAVEDSANNARIRVEFCDYYLKP